MMVYNYDNTKELKELTCGITISVRQAYNENGSPDIGIRGAVDGDVRRDFVTDSVRNNWLIAGDIFSTKSGVRRITSIHSFKHLAPNDIVVELRGQSLLNEGIGHAELGTRHVATINVVSDELVLIRLAD